MPKSRKIPYLNNGKVFVDGGLRKRRYKTRNKSRKLKNRKQKGAGLGTAISNLAGGLVNPLIKLLS